MAQIKTRILKDPASQKELEAKAYFGANNLLVDPPVKRAAYSDRMGGCSHPCLTWCMTGLKKAAKRRHCVLKKLEGGGFNWIAGFFN